MKRPPRGTALKEIVRHGEVYGPGEEPPEDGKGERFFAPGGLVILIFLIVTLFGTALLKDWLRALF
jgi:hypothetical protein